MQKTLLLSLAWQGRCLVIALHTHVTNKSGAYQVTQDIFSMIAIYSALLGPQAPQTKFEYVRDAIRTYNKDLHRKTLIPGISFSARYASRTSRMSSSFVLTD